MACCKIEMINWPDPLQSRHTALLEIQKEDNPPGVVQCYSFLTDI